MEFRIVSIKFKEQDIEEIPRHQTITVHKHEHETMCMSTRHGMHA